MPDSSDNLGFDGGSIEVTNIYLDKYQIINSFLDERNDSYKLSGVQERFRQSPNTWVRAKEIMHELIGGMAHVMSSHSCVRFTYLQTNAIRLCPAYHLI